MTLTELCKSEIANAKKGLANAYIQLHKAGCSQRYKNRWSNVIERFQQTIQFNAFRLAHVDALGDSLD